MNFSFEEAHKHQKEQNKIVRDTLKKIAKVDGQTYHESIRNIIDQNEELTVKFWDEIRSKYQNQFNRLSYCQSCKKFDLYHEED